MLLDFTRLLEDCTSCIEPITSLRLHFAHTSKIPKVFTFLMLSQLLYFTFLLPSNFWNIKSFTRKEQKFTPTWSKSPIALVTSEIVLSSPSYMSSTVLNRKGIASYAAYFISQLSTLASIESHSFSVILMRNSLTLVLRRSLTFTLQSYPGTQSLPLNYLSPWPLL